MLDFELKSEVTPIVRRAFPVATVDANNLTIINPNSLIPLVLGEFLELDTSYEMIRGAEAAGGTTPSFAVWGERGRTDMQSLQKAPTLYLGPYEADTKVMDPTALAIGAKLMVADVTYGSLTRRGLKLEAGGVYVVGRVTRLPANNNGYLRFARVMT